jgi:GT2 family glycosyltransferase
MTKTAVVILNWNGREFLEKFLPTLIAHTQDPATEIIIADNDSSDDSVAYLAEHYKDLKLIRLERNHGFAGGYNEALRQVEAEYYMLLNSDIEVTGNWLVPLVDHLDQHSEVAACSPILLDQQQRDMFEYAGAAGGYIDRYGYTFCRGRIFHTTERYTGKPGQPLEVFWTTGACMLIRSALFHEAGGFDAHFFAHMEEVDLCWRLKNRGHKLTMVPSSQVYHVGGGTLPKSNPFKTYLNFRNNLFLLYKNLPGNELRSTIRSRILMDGISALLFLVTLKFGDFSAVYRAHRDFRKKKADYRETRERSGPTIKKTSHPEIYNRSIVFDYFIAGKKQFNQLRDQFGQRMDQRVTEHKNE